MAVESGAYAARVYRGGRSLLLNTGRCKLQSGVESWEIRSHIMR